MLPCRRHVHLNKPASFKMITEQKQSNYKNDSKTTDKLFKHNLKTMRKNVQTYHQQYSTNLNIGSNLGPIWAPKWHQNRTQKGLQTGSDFLLLKQKVTLLQGHPEEAPRKPQGSRGEAVGRPNLAPDHPWGPKQFPLNNIFVGFHALRAKRRDFFYGAEPWL